MFELYSICFCAMLSLSQVDPPKIFVFLCWRLSIIPPLMITGIRDSSNLTNRETAMVNTDQSEEWRVENLRAATRKVQQKYFKRVAKELCISGSIEVFILSQFSAWASLKKCNASKLFVHGGVGANCIWQDTRCDVWCGCCAPLLPPSASVSCSEYRTRFSYTHQISENRYIQSHTASVNETEL